MLNEGEEEFEDIDDDDDELGNENADDSVKTDSEGEGQDPSKTKTDSDSDVSDKKDDQEDEEDLSNKYRPSDEKKDKKPETVPLKKYLDLKAKFKAAQEEGDNLDLSNESLEEFAEEAGLKLPVVKKLAKLIVAQATAEATRAADERVKPLVQERISKESELFFDQDFEKNIATNYPDLAAKKEAFKKIAFSKDFIHLKSLEEIRTEFYPDSNPVSKEAKKDFPEPGSKGGNKDVERINFASLKENPAQYAKVMKDSEARAKYYEWQDSQVNI
jgi:hypothetical protein